MRKITLDADLAAKLGDLTGEIALCDAAGNVVACVVPPGHREMLYRLAGRPVHRRGAGTGRAERGRHDYGRSVRAFSTSLSCIAGVREVVAGFGGGDPVEGFAERVP